MKIKAPYMNDFEKFMLDPIYSTKVTVKTLSQAIEEFKQWRGFKVTGHTVARYDSPLRIFCLTLRDPDIREVTDSQMIEHVMLMQRLGWKRNGISIVVLAFHKFLEFCNLKGYSTISPDLIPLPRKEFNIPRVANEQDFAKLLGVIPQDSDANNIRNRALLGMVWDTWARSGEVVSLNESDLNFNGDLSGSAIIKTEKSRGRRPIREIFWTAETGRDVKRWIEKRHELAETMCFEDPDALFVSIRKCGAYDSRGKRMTNRGVCEVFRMLSNRARLPSMFNPHSARHFGGRQIIKAGGSSADVSNILGHSNMESSYVYQMMWGPELEQRYRQFRKRV